MSSCHYLHLWLLRFSGDFLVGFRSKPCLEERWARIFLCCAVERFPEFEGGKFDKLLDLCDTGLGFCDLCPLNLWEFSLLWFVMTWLHFIIEQDIRFLRSLHWNRYFSPLMRLNYLKDTLARTTGESGFGPLVKTRPLFTRFLTFVSLRRGVALRQDRGTWVLLCGTLLCLTENYWVFSWWTFTGKTFISSFLLVSLWLSEVLPENEGSKVGYLSSLGQKQERYQSLSLTLLKC